MTATIAEVMVATLKASGVRRVYARTNLRELEVE